MMTMTTMRMSRPGQSSARNPATLSATFASLFPAGVVAAELRTPGDPSLLEPEEALAVARAVPRRAQEFAAGRLCARRALAEFGIVDFPVRAAGDRQPIWPEFLVGSVTHTQGICAAVLAARTRLAAIGVDTEVAGAVKRELWARICVAAELAWLESLEIAAPAAALIFSAKEAFYKCLYSWCGARLNFHDVRITVSDWPRSQGVLHIAPARPIALSARVCATYRLHEEFVSTAVFLPAEPGAR
jgi:4'-phosphopantetheinyl transferase EntD